MSDYGLQAQQEMWDTIAANDRPAVGSLADERSHWQAVAAGAESPRRELYRDMSARYAGSCDGCPRRVRRGDAILYTSHAPTGFKVFHVDCFPVAS